MRILHIQETLAPNFGGPARVLPELAAAQARAGLDVEILTTNADTPRGRYCEAGRRVIEGTSVPVTYCEVRPDIMRVSGGFVRFLHANARSFDLVHVHGLYRFPQSYAARFARLSGIAYIIRPHGSLDPYLFARSSTSVALKRVYEWLVDVPNLNGADAIHYTSEDERKLAAYMKIRAPSFVVPNGLDWGRYNILPVRGALRARLGLRDEPMVLFLGRLHHKKGMDILVDAFAGLHGRNPNVRLVIAGPDSDGYGAEVRKWIAQRRIEHVVTFTGPLGNGDVVQAFVDCDVFVLPSYTENFGMSVIEALACATPVVISDRVNIHHEVSSAQAGIVTRCDAAEVAAALETLLSDAPRRRALGAAGREFVQRRFAWPSIVEALSREYETILARHRAG